MHLSGYNSNITMFQSCFEGFKIGFEINQCYSSIMSSARGKALTVEEAVQFVTADDDSDFNEEDEEESEIEESTEEEIEEDSEAEVVEGVNDDVEKVPLPVKWCRTRGGAVRRAYQNRTLSKAEEEARLENKWKKGDKQSTVTSFTAVPGLNVGFPDDASELEFFKEYITDELLDIITEQTNIYAGQYIASQPDIGPHTLARRWTDVTIEVIKKFLALSLLMGIVQKPAVYFYWSQNPILKASVYNVVMPRNPFQIIHAFLHFADNTYYDPTDPKHDRLYRPVQLLNTLYIDVNVFILPPSMYL